MKTIKEWLMELPDWYRELALKYENGAFQEDAESMLDALHGFIPRKKTNETPIFWYKVLKHYEEWAYLPPLPDLPLTKDERQFHTYMSLPQLTMKLDTWEVYPVASLVRMDGGKTLRAFPQKKLKKWEIKSYVIYTENPEEREVGAVLVC